MQKNDIFLQNLCLDVDKSASDFITLARSEVRLLIDRIGELEKLVDQLKKQIEQSHLLDDPQDFCAFV